MAQPARAAVRIQPHTVAHRAWPEDGQHEIRPAANAPITQRLAEVLVVFLQPVRDIEQAEDAERAVEQETRAVGDGLGELELQQVVGGDDDIIQVGEKIAHHDLAGERHYGVVALRHRFGDGPVDGVIELVNAAVE